jgi:protein-S-isoprenylcysteine O-methyltransferase Ste14
LEPAVARLVATALFVLGLLAFLDAAFLTLGQRWVARRSRERWILLTLEVDLVALWAVAVAVLGWRWRVVPTGAEGVAAAAGLALVGAGTGLAVWGKWRLGRMFSATFGIKRDHVLVTDGPFAITRHPIYSGILVALAGSALVWNLALNLALAAGFAIAFWFHTVFEEELFEKHFGEAWHAYRERVPRLVPFLRRR